MPVMAPHDNLPLLIQALLAPSAFPGAADKVELLQTHISWVLLAGDFAYKIKKPIKLPFLDFSTLALRKRYCEDELRLNRRHAPDIYLDVVAICDTPQGPRFDVADGTPVEYAVKMRRFDEAGRLDHLCARGVLTAAHVSDLAGAVADFHAEAAVASANSHFGAPQQVLAPMLDNFHDLAELMVPDADMRRRLQALRSWTEQQFELLTPVLQARKAGGMVRECHGDLHLANMVLIDGRVRLFDCLEFNEDLRWTDIAGDVAFAYVDLLEHDQAALANWFVNEALARSGDYASAGLLRFYGVYRAMVRAKVAAIRASQTGDIDDDDDDSTEAIRQCLSHAERLAAPVPVRLVITHGLAGCGKTFVSTRLLQQGGAWQRTLRLRSDVERKRLYGLAPTQRSGSTTGDGIYSADAHTRTYAHLLAMAQPLLRAGWSVLVDAAFLKRAQRDTFHALATHCGAGFGILAPQADTDILRQRIQARQALGSDASEATLDVLEQQLRWIEPLDDDEEKTWVMDPALA